MWVGVRRGGRLEEDLCVDVCTRNEGEGYMCIENQECGIGSHDGKKKTGNHDVCRNTGCLTRIV